MRGRRISLVLVVLLACESGDGGGFSGALETLKNKLAAGAIEKALDAAVKAASQEIQNAIAPAANAGLASLPASATGGVDLAKGVTGKTGSFKQDMDGDGDLENVEVIESEDGTTFLSWEDNGACFLAWKDSSGKEFYQLAKCNDESGAYVCSGKEPNYSCKACDASGACETCSGLDLSTCSWRKDSGGTDDSSDASDGSSDMSDGSSDMSDGSSDMSDGSSDMSDGSSDASDGSSDASDGSSDDGVDTTDVTDGASDDGLDMSDGTSDDGLDMTDTADGASGDGFDMSDSVDATDGADATEGDHPYETTCSETLECFGVCEAGDTVCLDDCYFYTFPDSQVLLDALSTCLDVYCPDHPANCALCDAEREACLND